MTAGKGAVPAFGDFLDGLNANEQRKEAAMRKELKELYDNWAYHIELLKEQFSEVWELFGSIESRVQGWYRGEHSYGQWDYMGASGYGYNFGTGIHYLGPEPGQLFRPLLGGSKYLIVSFAHDTNDFKDGPNGCGDERDVGRDEKTLDQNLVGLERCTEKTMPDQLWGVKYMLEKFDSHTIKFFVRQRDIGNQFFAAGVGYMYEHTLAEACKRIFLELNKDEDVRLSDYLPAPEEGSYNRAQSVVYQDTKCLPPETSATKAGRPEIIDL